MPIYNLKMLSIALMAFFSLFLTTLETHAELTPSHVYQQANNIYAEVALIRKALGVKKKVRDPGVQTDKMPIHVYSKALEVLEKISKLQASQNITAASIPRLPAEEVTPEIVYEMMQTLLQEIHRVKEKIGLNETIIEADFIPERTPSNVYEKLWQVSFLLDGMIKRIDSNDVFRNVQLVHDELAIVADHLNKTLPDVAPEIPNGKRPKQVHLQGYLNLHKLAQLEKHLDMKPFRVPIYPEGKIMPSDVYDTTHMMLAELVRIKLHLGLSQEAAMTKRPTAKKPAHVLSQMELLDKQISYLIK